MVRWWWCQRDEVSPESFNLGKLPINWLRWYQLSQSREGSIDTENESEVTSYKSESTVFLDALASLRPILFSECVLFLGLQITSESISENVIGLCQYHKHQC